MKNRDNVLQSLHPAVHRMRGFSLVELLVAMAIALLGSLVIMQVFVNSEAGRRATGSLADSQTNALLGLFAIERDLQQAGLGFTSTRSLGCRVRSSGSFNNKPLMPVAIVPAGAGAGAASNPWGIPPGDADSDIILVAYGNANVMVEGSKFTGTTTASPFRLYSVLGLAVGDYMLMAQAETDCTLGRLTNVNNGDSSVTLDYSAGIAYSMDAAYGFNLGRAPRIVAYAVRNGSLTVCDFLVSDCSNGGQTADPNVWVPVASDVVAIVAQYGWDTSASPDMVTDALCKTRLTSGGACPPVDSGEPAAGNSSLTQSQRACDWSRVPSVRLALVTRSGQYEKEEVSPATIRLWPDAAGTPTTTGPIYTPPDRHYRYRVAYTTVALRNVIWMGAQSAC